MTKLLLIDLEVKDYMQIMSYQWCRISVVITYFKINTLSYTLNEYLKKRRVVWSCLWTIIILQALIAWRNIRRSNLIIFIIKQWKYLRKISRFQNHIHLSHCMNEISMLQQSKYLVIKFPIINYNFYYYSC